MSGQPGIALEITEMDGGDKMNIEEIKKRIIDRGYIGYEETLLSSLERVETKNRLIQRMVDRWVPCPDHRDKMIEGKSGKVKK